MRLADYTSQLGEAILQSIHKTSSVNTLVILHTVRYSYTSPTEV